MLILVAGLVFFVAAFAILTVDVSKLLVTRAQLQNAADAGALAGAEMFMQNPVPGKAEIEARARELATANRAFSESPSKPVDNVSTVEVTAFDDPTLPNTYGMVKCVTRSVVSQYFTALPGQNGKASDAANPDKLGNVAAQAVARAGPVDRVPCLKPWAIPDRWDDFTFPNDKAWAGNKQWDSEKFTDNNGNRLYDPGEQFMDGSSAWTKGKTDGIKDGVFDQEYYHPLNTGYVAWKDLGLELTLKAGQPSGTAASGQYYPIDLPVSGSAGKDLATGADRYRYNIANCNPSFYGPGDTVMTETGDMHGPTSQGMDDLVNQDPGAYWDDGCECVKSRFGDASPRIVFVPLYDPRIPLSPGKQSIKISKIAAFFIESSGADGSVRGRFVRVASPTGQIGPPNGSGGFVYTISLIDPGLIYK